MIDINEIKTKLIQDYRRLWINKHKFEINDDQIDVEDCNSKLEYIVELLMFITGESREKVGEGLALHLNYIIDFDPGENHEKWELTKFDYVELQHDVWYNDLATALEDWETTEEYLIRNGFRILDDTSHKCKWVLIPKGTVMKFLGADCNGWPEFSVRMKLEDYDLTFAGDPFKVKLI